MATVIKTGFVSGVVVLALGLVGCDSVDGDDLGFGEGGVVQARDTQWNDFKLNDFKLNDFKLNGARLNDFKLNGDSTSEWIEFLRFKMDDGEILTDGAVNQGGITLDGGWYSAWDLEDGTFDFNVRKNGVTTLHKVRVGWVQGAGPGVWEYELDVKVGGGSYQPLCTDSNGDPIRALVLADVWDPDTGAKVSPRPSGAMTFACKDAALAKCVTFGYRPWASVSGTSLANYHQACTRMVRADYCGDGTPHTVSGTPVHVLDQLGIQTADPGGSYVVEAEWGPDGAVCLNPNNTRLPDQTIACSIPTCGSPFASGGLIQSGKIVP